MHILQKIAGFRIQDPCSLKHDFLIPPLVYNAVVQYGAMNRLEVTRVGNLAEKGACLMIHVW